MPTEPRLNHFLGLGSHGFHRVAYTEWGNRRAQHVVICVHGLTHNSRDFDELAADLAARDCRVVCMDVVGRGDSDWLEHKDDYGFAQYLSDAAALLARLTAPHPVPLLQRLQGKSDGREIDWVGTSMGGLIGMMLAAKANSPIRRLVLNDVGPLVPWHALVRLKLASSGAGARFATLDAVERHLREACASFGPLTDEQWRRLAQHDSRRREDGSYSLAYDPAIVSAMRRGGNAGVEFGNDYLFGINLWPVWDAVTCPTLVLRGAESDLLLESTVRQMQERGPRVKLVEFPGVGHAPWLKSEDQIAVVRDFLLAPELTGRPA